MSLSPCATPRSRHELVIEIDHETAIVFVTSMSRVLHAVDHNHDTGSDMERDMFAARFTTRSVVRRSRSKITSASARDSNMTAIDQVSCTYWSPIGALAPTLARSLAPKRATSAISFGGESEV